MAGLRTTPYAEHATHWPASGRHILAQWDEDSIFVYQAYNAEIADFALDNGRFGGAFSFDRMSWIKTNFLWMMYRSDWGTKLRQERTLAIQLHRPVFDRLLSEAVPSMFDPNRFDDETAWSRAVARWDVRLQWDPDHSPSGARQRRRAIQLGLRRRALIAVHGGDGILAIHDLTRFVEEQRQHVRNRSWSDLVIPVEEIYPVEDPKTRAASRRSGDRV